MTPTKLEIFVSSGSKGKGQTLAWHEIFFSKEELTQRLGILDYKKEKLNVKVAGLCYFDLSYSITEASLGQYLLYKLLNVAKIPKPIQRPENVEACLAARTLLLSETKTSADTLTEVGVIKGAAGLQRLAEADDFWEQQPYGKRLYFGEGAEDYLHRDVLRTAIQVLETINKP